MIVDSSALLVILKNDPEAAEFRLKLEEARASKISAATYVEVACVVDSARDPLVSRRLDDLLREANCRLEPVTETQAHLARQAYRDYGKGSGHRAGLNFGDCFAYALAKDTREPLLFKGDDFTHTDVEPA